MLARTGRAQKPAIVCHIGEKIGAAQDKLAGELTDRVLKANQGSDATMVFRKLKDGEFMADIEIFRHLIACDLCKKWEGMPQRDVFAKGHQVNFAIKLDRLIRSKRKSGIIDAALRWLIDNSQQNVDPGRGGQSADEIERLLVFEHGCRHGALGPNQEINGRS